MTQVKLWERTLSRASLEAEEPCIRQGPDVLHFKRGGLYSGVDAPIVLCDESPFIQRLILHSPTGFEWGYTGSGPADLALNILYLYVNYPRALRLHQRFKDDFVARIPKEGGLILREQVMAWLRAIEIKESSK